MHAALYVSKTGLSAQDKKLTFAEPLKSDGMIAVFGVNPIPLRGV